MTSFQEFQKSIRPPITATMTLKEILDKYPDTQIIFENYGLTDRCQLASPISSLAFLALSNGIDPAVLLKDLNNFVLAENEEKSKKPPSPDHSEYYRIYIKGAFLLLFISFPAMIMEISRSKFFLFKYEEILLLILIGICLRVFPRLWGVKLKGKSAMIIAFYLIIFRSIALLYQNFFAKEEAFLSQILNCELIAVILITIVFLLTSANIKEIKFPSLFKGDKFLWFGLLFLFLSRGFPKYSLLKEPFPDLFLGFFLLTTTAIFINTLPTLFSLKSVRQNYLDFGFLILTFWGFFSLLNGINYLGIPEEKNILYFLSFQFLFIFLIIKGMRIFSRPEYIEGTIANDPLPLALFRISFTWAILIHILMIFSALSIFQYQKERWLFSEILNYELFYSAFCMNLIFAILYLIIPILEGTPLFKEKVFISGYLLFQLGMLIYLALFLFFKSQLPFPIFVLAQILEWLGSALIFYTVWKTLNIGRGWESIKEESNSVMENDN